MVDWGRWLSEHFFETTYTFRCKRNRRSLFSLVLLSIKKEVQFLIYKYYKFAIIHIIYVSLVHFVVSYPILTSSAMFILFFKNNDSGSVLKFFSVSQMTTFQFDLLQNFLAITEEALFSVFFSCRFCGGSHKWNLCRLNITQTFRYAYMSPHSQALTGQVFTLYFILKCHSVC